jgi:Kef-type K+ transport system membrane component KefB/Cdc6-like AAA superfamily ATPase
MRRFFILGILSALMYGLNWFEVGDMGAGVNPRSLAAFGFILLAAYTIGELAKNLKIPAVTGFLIAGVLFGPFGPFGARPELGAKATFLTQSVVNELKLINNLAVGLIALTAGGELQLSALRQNIRSIMVIIGSQAMIIMPIVTGIFFLSGRYLVPWESLGISGGASTTFIIGIGLLLGAIAVGNSPSVAVAIVNETGSQGPFTSVNMGVTIVKDLIVVMLCAVTAAVSVTMLDPQGVFDLKALALHLAYELGLSVAVGAVIGVLLWLYLKYVKVELMLFLVGFIFLGMYAAEVFHLEKILVFIAAGFVVENAWALLPTKFRAKWLKDQDAHLGHKMIEAVQKVSLPVFVVFFAAQGANLNLALIQKVIWVALIIAAARMGLMMYATRVGSKLAGLGAIYQDKLGMGFFSQAGVTLGITALTSAKLNAIPFEIQIGSAFFEPIMMGVVAANLVIGPVMLKNSLAAAGETAEARKRSPKPSVAATAATTPGEGVSAVRMEEIDPLKLAFAEPGFEDERINAQIERVRSAALRSLRDFDAGFLALTLQDNLELAEQIRRVAHQALDELRQGLLASRSSEQDAALVEQSRVKAAERLLLALGADRALDRSGKVERRAIKRLLSTLEGALRALEGQTIDVPLSADLFSPVDGDTLWLKARKRMTGWTLRAVGTEGRTRQVDLYRLARFYLTGPLPSGLLPMANMVGYQRLFLWQKVEQASLRIDAALSSLSPQGRPPGERLDDAALSRVEVTLNGELDLIHSDLRTLHDDIMRRLRLSLARKYEAMLSACGVAGTFLLPERRTRYAQVHDLNLAGKQSIKLAIQRWRQASVGFSGRLMAYLDLISLQHTVLAQASGASKAIAGALHDELRPKPEMIHVHLRNMVKSLTEQLSSPSMTPEVARKALIEARDDLSDLITRQAIMRLEVKRDRGAFSDVIGAFLEALRQACLEVQASYEVSDAVSFDNLDEGSTPPAFSLTQLPLRDLARRALLGEIPVRLAPINTMIKGAVEQTIAHLSNVLRIITYQFDTLISDLIGDAPAHDTFTDSATHPANTPSHARVEAAKEAALGGLQRCRTLLQETLTMIAEVNEQAQHLVQHETNEQLQRLHVLALHSTWPAIQRYLDRKGADDPDEPDAPLPSSRAQALSRAWQRALASVHAVRVGVIAPSVRALYDGARDRLGLTEDARPALIELTDALLHPAATKGGGVPLSYRRPFESAPVDMDEFFISRDTALAQATSAFERFQRKLPSSVLIFGEQGCGKTSFAERLLRRVSGTLPVARLSVSHTLSAEEPLRMALCELLGEPPALSFEHLRSRLRARRRPQAVLIEGLHKLFLRTLRGADALQQFLLLVSETSHALLWVVTVNSDALQHLRQMVRVDDSFTHHITLRRFDAHQLRQMIESRHRVTGYQLRYRAARHATQPSDADGDTNPAWWSRLSRRKQQAQSARADTFFQQLAHHSAGNIRLALFYWLRALEPAPEGRQGIRVSPITPLDASFLRDLDLEQRLALALLIQHGGLTLREYAAVARQPLDAARSLLTGLQHTHLLTIERGQSDIFHVNAILFALIADHLRALRIL